ncbi:MAG TPA: hypothetical protein VHU83_06490, partial [Bryobacteraceae bacterium]|nr:hypothetical protein [Bryobacteraceae bacterium]
PKQSLLGALGIGIAALVEAVHLPWLQHACVFAKPREIHVSLKQFLRLAMAIVERVHEVEADIARNQIEAGRTPAGY